jgi:hypothetical protein
LFESLVLDEGLFKIVHLLELRWWDVAGALKEPAVVEPVHPLERGELHVFEGLPGAALADEFGLEKPVDGLGRRIIVGIPAGPHRGDGTGLGQALGVADGEVLRRTPEFTLDTAVTVVNEAPNVTRCWSINAVISSVGGRTPPRKKPRLP